MCAAAARRGGLVAIHGIVGLAQEPQRPSLQTPSLGAGPYIFDTAEQHRIRVSVIARGPGEATATTDAAGYWSMGDLAPGQWREASVPT